MLTGHRGAALLAPENTLAGIEAAAKAGVNWVEIDTQLSADKVPVVIHDKTVNRTSNGKGKVGEMSVEELKAVDVGSWFSEDFAGETIPTLAEALETCLRLDLTLNLELKIHNDVEAIPLVEHVVKLIKTTQFPIDKLLLSSFNKNALLHCQTLIPEVRRGFICEVWNDFSLDSLVALELFSVHMDHNILTPEIAQSIKQEELTLMIWTLNQPEKAQHFKEMGVDNIITDNPDSFD
ncbi:glycerophosphoryl diester phosphodiesterase [Photobacterium sanctipauli]|uniref:Glycerophosphoryl diester phosphodiesterase n=1 Tax=Photobacterium sanctipauli TaxID=1342794 RepID=A0A2T3NV02_9GAMM|nr:glycerophosphodiester phosphodiesterase family protein [Photobacterium sanctipauli]PSW20126.1 glycerophosphoryl diester phosphodiesterase [Photobacterium sanctipauli]